jgi:hypothetical protein
MAVIRAILPTINNQRPADEEEAMETVLGNMGAIATTPNFFERKRDHLECESMHLCAGSLCHGEPVLRCSQCKTVRYCGQECQPRGIGKTATKYDVSE